MPGVDEIPSVFLLLTSSQRDRMLENLPACFQTVECNFDLGVGRVQADILFLPLNEPFGGFSHPISQSMFGFMVTGLGRSL